MPAYDLTQPLLTSNGNTSRSLPSPPIRFPANLFHFLTVWALKTLFHAYTTALSLLSHLHLRPRPNLTKTYASAPHSPVHLFLPPAASSTATPPLLISLHGGAFTLGAPALDHPDACAYATTHHIAVACIGYRLAPLHRFPAGVHDAAALIASVLADASLPVDRTRVAVCGYSAGANLALAATQLLPSPSARVRGVVAFYPVVDFSLDHAERVRRARAGPACGAPFQHFGWVRWAYVPEGQDLRDPLLSPVYAERGRLPAKVCLVGCERDMLCAEAEAMAEKLAEEEEEERKAEEGTDGEGTAWRAGGVRWEKLGGMVHGFNQVASWGERGRRERARAERMRASVARWLFEEVYV